ncbi:MAG TPA: chemotaxis protein CheB [Cyclobacteriaceae bacterium]|jgi:two-component system chemotaxis response regulator CheB|nr:chemotaxis protein CheB [Cytophagales bacterium]HMR55693.1 chemotaxis protein CheB [Cyclobacteriaceae bacterium]HNT49625.1 chemotaxis protein CheB [Cyclobacteriaceae bacterium]HRE67690.1 chemotaxis protein CheB [Cyclobacteriaceae bacterium]HRG10387.1 chemotaxis protein CheB [Cyclobacteriaceae bacterium]
MSRYNLNNSYKAIVIGGSAGSFQGIIKILSQLSADFPLPIIMALHRLKHVRHGFVEALSIKSNIKISEPEDKESIRKGMAYLAPANYHLSVELGNYFSLSTEEMVNNSRPAIDITLGSAAYLYRTKLVGILLSGANRDGALGMKQIKDKGGITIIQDPAECMIDTMPKAAQSITTIDHTLGIDSIVAFLKELQQHYK